MILKITIKNETANNFDGSDWNLFLSGLEKEYKNVGCHKLRNETHLFLEHYHIGDVVKYFTQVGLNGDLASIALQDMDGDYIDMGFI